jgi:hypothetical protein
MSDIPLENSDSAQLPYQGRKRGRKPRQPIAAHDSGFMDTRTRRPRLTTQGAWRRELRFIYRETLEGRIPTGEATRLTYIVNVGANLEQAAENSEAIRRIEARIARLEGSASTTAFETPLLTHEEGSGETIEGEVVPNTDSSAASAEAV